MIAGTAGARRITEYRLPSFRAMASDASEDAKKGMGGAKKNKLAFQKSPYLLQHAENPVDWWVDPYEKSVRN